MTTDPTTPRPTDAAIALLAEALHSGVLMHAAAPDDVIKTRTPGFSVDGALMRDRLVEGLLAHPTLARVIAIGQALDTALTVWPEGHRRLILQRGADDEPESRMWYAAVEDPETSDGTFRHALDWPTALRALAAALTDQERGS